MSYNLGGKKILVTGATRGIGRELVDALLKHGAEVYGLASNKDLLDKLVTECPDVKPVHVDLGDWDGTRKELEKLPVMYGIVNNAVYAHEKVPSLVLTNGEINQSLSVNVLGPINVIQVLGKKMVDSGNGGSIVNMSSIVSINPMRNFMAYNVSKAALDMVTKQFALEFGPHNIRVNSINPTAVLTEQGRQFDQSTFSSSMKSHTPLGRFAEVSEAVNPILYLLSDCSSMVTGTQHVVDGGILSNVQT
ncbi:hypothetical protein ACF0H5_016209 [Mactra antiquata]